MLARSNLFNGRYLSVFVGIVMVLASLSACTTSNSTNNSTTPQNTSPITIGYTVPRTGDFSGDGPLLEQGYQLWADQINKNGGLLGRQVKLIGEDDASKPEQVTTDYQSLITVNHVDLLFAPFSGDLTVPAAIVAHRFGYVMVEGAATEKATYQHGLDNLFAVSLPAEHYITSFANFILSLPQAQRPTTAAYVTSNDPFTEPQVAAARDLLENNGQPGGLDSVLYRTFGPETTNYRTLAAEMVQSGAQVVVLGTLDVNGLSQFMKYFRSQHYNPEALIAATGPDQGSAYLNAIGDGNPKDTAFANRMAEGTFVPNDGWYPGINTYQNDVFTQDWQAKNPGQPPDGISSDTVQGFAAAQVLQQAIEATHSIDNTTLKAYLRSHTFNSIQGAVQFDAQGRNTVAVAFLFQWQNGKLLPVYPPSRAAANPEFPKMPWP